MAINDRALEVNAEAVSEMVEDQAALVVEVVGEIHSTAEIRSVGVAKNKMALAATAREIPLAAGDDGGSAVTAASTTEVASAEGREETFLPDTEYKGVSNSNFPASLLYAPWSPSHNPSNTINTEAISFTAGMVTKLSQVSYLLRILLLWGRGRGAHTTAVFHRCLF